MWKVILHPLKTTFPFLIGLSVFLHPAYSQQNIIADKDNTRPEVTNGRSIQQKITSPIAEKNDGFNTIQWASLSNDDIRRFTIEYSNDGINYQPAGDVTPLNSDYFFKHYISTSTPLLYRIRADRKDGKFFYSDNFMLKGAVIDPVKVYPTAISNNTVHLQSVFGIEKVAVVSFNGIDILDKSLGGAAGAIDLTIPTLTEGMYIITFYGDGWKSSAKIVIDR